MQSRLSGSPICPCPSLSHWDPRVPHGSAPPLQQRKAGGPAQAQGKMPRVVYLKVKQPFAKLHPFLNVRDGVVKTALRQSQHLRGRGECPSYRQSPHRAGRGPSRAADPAESRTRERVGAPRTWAGPAAGPPLIEPRTPERPAEKRSCMHAPGRGKSQVSVARGQGQTGERRASVGGASGEMPPNAVFH